MDPPFIGGAVLLLAWSLLTAKAVREGHVISGKEKLVKVLVNPQILVAVHDHGRAASVYVEGNYWGLITWLGRRTWLGAAMDSVCGPLGCSAKGGCGVSGKPCKRMTHVSVDNAYAALDYVLKSHHVAEYVPPYIPSSFLEGGAPPVAAPTMLRKQGDWSQEWDEPAITRKPKARAAAIPMEEVAPYVPKVIKSIEEHLADAEQFITEEHLG